MWKYILDHRYLVQNGLLWILGNGERIKLWLDNWMEESPIIEKIHQDYRSTIVKTLRSVISSMRTRIGK